MTKSFSLQMPSLDNVCYLVGYTSPHKDKIGQFIKGEKIKTLCFCAEGSIYCDEFFTAGQQGIRPKVKLIVDSESYNGETNVIYNEEIYSVYRSFKRADSTTELIFS